MKKQMLWLPFLAMLLFQNCKKDDAQDASQQSLQLEYECLSSPNYDGSVNSRSNCDWTVLDAGSTDALAAAIANTCEHGVIYLRAGQHIENQAITINKSVKIIGEAGAVLRVKSDLAPSEPVTFLTNVYPGLHVLNVPDVLIQDLEIRPLGNDGGTAILFENAHGSAVMRNKIFGFQFGVVVEKSDRTTIMFNELVATGLWQTGAVTDAESIVVVNGSSTYIADNEVSNALFGIWACSTYGTAERNFTHDNYLGIILCNVPQYLRLPSGDITGSIIPGHGWKIRNNKSINNFNVGYLVIDSANNNLLENNEAYGNADYDIELTTDSYRFGFLTPRSHDNTVIAGAYPNVTIKDCGEDNTVIGGVWVDVAVDTCE